MIKWNQIKEEFPDYFHDLIVKTKHGELKLAQMNHKYQFMDMCKNCRITIGHKSVVQDVLEWIYVDRRKSDKNNEESKKTNLP
jgi:hypothetical protein